MNNNPWYFLDPDNNKEDPKTGLFCCRCKKPIKTKFEFINAKFVERHPEHPWVRIKLIGGTELIGFSCWKKIVKEGEAHL